jgi:hypothetical protein
LNKIAKIISFLGNPMFIGLGFGLYLNFFNKEPGSLHGFTLLFAAIVVLPLLIFMVYNVKKGNFENYDVSNRLDRNKLYQYLICVFFGLGIFIFLKDYPSKAKILIIILNIHLLFSYLINQKIKISMHASFNVLFAFIFYPLNSIIAICLFVFSFFNMWSRLQLSRHKTIEVVLGFCFGTIMGSLYLVLFKFYV